MRLLYLNHNYRHSGTYYRAMPMAEQMAARGHQVTLLTVSREHRWKPAWSMVNGVRLGEMPNLLQNVSGEGYGPIDNVLRLWHALAHRYDIIHMFDHRPNASFAGFTGRWRGARLVADWADWWGGPGGVNDFPNRRVKAIGRFEERWEEQSKLWADRVVTISTVLRQRAIELGVPAKHVLYLPTGAPLDRITPLPTAQARQQLGVPIDRRIAGFIGIGQGELDLIMQAQQQIANLWLMVIGPKTPRVLNLAHSLGVADRLWQTGFVADQDVSCFLACADVMCMPMHDSLGNRGRLPNKLLDYLAAGRPIVANPIGDVKMIIEQHQAGLLTDEPGFARGIQYLYDHPAERETLGCNARRAAETEFAWPRLIDQLEAFYRDLLAV